MIIALLADIHSNLEALDACLAHARARGTTRLAFLGDLVGYGADPAAVIERVADHVRDGALIVKGNHDEAVEGSRAYFNDAAAASIDWTRERLGESHREFLRSLPLCVREEGACFVHASAADAAKWTYVDSPSAAARSANAAGTTFTFSGHVHDQGLYFSKPSGRMGHLRPHPGSQVPMPRHRRSLALVGSVGQPRDGNPAAAYALADTDRGLITFHRLRYDHFKAARKIREAGLPEALAHRLERGS